MRPYFEGVAHVNTSVLHMCSHYDNITSAKAPPFTNAYVFCFKNGVPLAKAGPLRRQPPCEFITLVKTELI